VKLLTSLPAGVGALAAAVVACTAVAAAAAPARPFGSHPVAYTAGSVLPSNQAARDSATASFYDQWKAKFLQAGCGSGRFFVNTHGDTDGMVVSEGQGYGMEIVPLMAGHDPNAQAEFDGLYKYFRDHPSQNAKDLMAWNQNSSCKNIGGADSATDGDISIAFGLLLADRQWGSAGAINYLAEGKKVIAAIKAHDVNPQTKLLNVGDWALGDSQFQFGTRPSDYMLDHIRAFRNASGDSFWDDVLTAHQNLIASMVAKFASGTGLMPDFIMNTNTSAKPAPANWLESPDDGRYSWNSCRFPWHIGTDWLVSGDARSRTEALKLSNWIKGKAGGNASNIGSGYALSGSSTSSDYSLAFAAPFAVAASVDSSQEAWLNTMWTKIVGQSLASDAYFANSIKMQVMLVLSNNFWLP